MSRAAPVHGVALLTPVSSREMAETLRQAISALGGNASVVVDPLTDSEAAAIGERISKKYGVALALGPGERKEIDFSVGYSNGMHLAKNNGDLPVLIRRLEILQHAFAEVLRAVNELRTGFSDDMVSRAAIEQVVMELVRAGHDPHPGSAHNRMELIGVIAQPVDNAVAGARAKLLSYASKRGRPQSLEEFDPFCRCCESLLAQQGIRTALASDPSIERPGVLLELARELQNYLLPPLRTDNPSTWTQRFRAVRRRQKPHFKGK